MSIISSSDARPPNEHASSGGKQQNSAESGWGTEDDMQWRADNKEKEIGEGTWIECTWAQRVYNDKYVYKLRARSVPIIYVAENSATQSGSNVGL